MVGTQQNFATECDGKGRREIQLGEKITIESILGSTMTVEAKEVVDFHGFQAILPEVSGTASFTGKSEFWFDPNDAYKEGFIFR